ncbi:MAG: heat shock protein HtpX [Myxococcota bacterium]
MRVLLFLITNVAVLAMAGVSMAVLTALGVIPPNSPFVGLLVWCALFGFGGSILSLAMSKWMAKRATGAKVITQPQTATEVWLVETVGRQAQKLGLTAPEVAIFPSRDPNAFATGMFKNSALVAVSVGLLEKMEKNEVEAVLGHEMAHVANGDMVTLALIQGVVNTFVLLVARIISSQFERGRFLIFMALQIGLGILASTIVAWFSRRREFRADAGGADLEGAPAMAAALERLRSIQSPGQLPESMAAFGIRSGGVSKLFSTHPPLEERIARLRLGGR